jgi:spore coat polysaccharide biosynthesis protein SpsF
MNANVGILMQVRLGSQRLPRKALLPLKGGSVIQHAMYALKRIPAAVYALVTDEASAPALRDAAGPAGFEVFTGSPDDVLDRYQKAATYYGLDTVVRATGDNPLVSAKLGEAIIRIHLTRGADLSHYLGIPLGTGIEVVARSALDYMALKARDPFEREHMTTYLYRHRDAFKVVEEESPKEYYFPQSKVSVDTEADYRSMCRIYEELYRAQPIEIDDLVPWLREYNDGKTDPSLTRPLAGDGDRTSGQMSHP